MTNTGWDEITTVKINLLKPLPALAFSTAGEWVVFQRRNPSLNKKGRNHCQCCSVKWENIYENIYENAKTYIVFTDKGNKIICQDCYDKLPTLTI